MTRIIAVIVTIFVGSSNLFAAQLSAENCRRDLMVASISLSTAILNDCDGVDYKMYLTFAAKLHKSVAENKIVIEDMTCEKMIKIANGMTRDLEGTFGGDFQTFDGKFCEN
ncbi:MAG: hypothetical protein HOO06_13650 [Bdellovibrionaceae bacterium]|jgi:hypothetical protein|nr:hypothetical protein [Pseudobdellovibrionaceae bacterium]